MRRTLFSRDVLLIAFSAFSADCGYQAVGAIFPLFLIFRLHQPFYVYGVITAVSFGGGAFFAYLGGKAGDRFDRKWVAIAGNCFIPLMSLSGLFRAPWLCGALFALGWWARYFRSPARRALLVDVSPPEHRAKAFGFLHALDIGGGLLSVLSALALVVFLHAPLGTILILTAAPLAVSSLLLFFVKRDIRYTAEVSRPVKSSAGAEPTELANRKLFISLLLASTLYGFSFYNAGYPVLSAAAPSTRGYALGLLAYAIYLGVSAISGYALAARRSPPIRALWSLGYLPSALASLLIGAALFFHLPHLAFYLFIAALGAGMGAVETFEPTATSLLVPSSQLSRGMGWLSVSRSVGQFVSNLVMGVLFSFSQAFAYGYAFAASLAAAAVLAFAERGEARKLGAGEK